MHYHLEVIMPPTNDVESSLKEILDPYYSEYEDEDGDNYMSRYAFYDYYVIGGRWSGYKLEAMLGFEKIKEFRDILQDEGITVSGLVFGKETLSPSSQIKKVNHLWNNFFPESPVKQCPFFDNYKSDYGDIMQFKEIPKDLTAARLIIARKPWDEEDKLKAEFMYTNEIWNGVTWQNTTWDGNVQNAIEKHLKRVNQSTDEYKEKAKPKDDWICVTVDYHN